jgi:hypothetical protein
VGRKENGKEVGKKSKRRGGGRRRKAKRQA